MDDDPGLRALSLQGAPVLVVHLVDTLPSAATLADGSVLPCVYTEVTGTIAGTDIEQTWRLLWPEATAAALTRHVRKAITRAIIDYRKEPDGSQGENE